MENEIKSALLFLLQTAQNHEARLLDVQSSNRAMSEASRSHDLVAYWEAYCARFDRLVRENTDTSHQVFAKLDELLRQIQQM